MYDVKTKKNVFERKIMSLMFFNELDILFLVYYFNRGRKTLIERLLTTMTFHTQTQAQMHAAQPNADMKFSKGPLYGPLEAHLSGCNPSSI